MNNPDFEESVSLFLEECDTWIDGRLEELAAQGFELSETDVEEIVNKVEENITAAIETVVRSHGQAFTPGILTDLHHLLFELELKKKGGANQDRIHRYKDNAQVGLSAVEGKITPDNAVLLMEINRAHLEKKGGKDEGVCEDCICGKK
jgi:hypothetical protein